MYDKLFLLMVFQIFRSTLSEECPVQLRRRYDYVVVGAGTAGSVVASRLSEDQDLTVLLLEAGKSDTDIPEAAFIQTPRLWFNAVLSNASWQYKTVPQRNALFGMENNVGSIPMGAVLGGSSSHNQMTYIRGSEEDFNYWAQQVGSEDWSYRNVLPFFKKSENIEVPELKNSPFHGKCGQITISSNSEREQIIQLYKRAAAEVGQPALDDCNIPSPLGICLSQNFIKAGQRESTATGFLRTAMGRPNLHILTGALCEKILINSRSRKAYGVKFFHKGKSQTVYINNEVIVSAGSIRSPQVLILSGIGPRDQLRRLKIRPINILPVGRNMMDHLGVGVEVTLNLDTLKINKISDAAGYLFQRTGVFADTPYRMVMVVKNMNARFPNYQYGLTNGLGENGVIVITEESYKALIAKAAKNETFRDGVIIIITSLHPQSRGTITLRNRNPFEFPLIDPNYLAVSRDIKDFIKAFRILEDYLSAPSFKKVNARLQDPIPQCAQFGNYTDAYIECLVKRNARTLHHFSTTCKMGKLSEHSTVVDSRLRVKGVRNIRVADASIMPEITSGNTAAPTIMIGEKAADFIKQDRRKIYK